MSNDLVLAQSHAYALARTLMAQVTVFQVDGAYGVLPSAEIDDADELHVIHEFDPYERRPAH